MSLVVGVTLPDGRVMMAADSFIGGGDLSENASVHKVRKINNILIGCVGSLPCLDFYLMLVNMPRWNGKTDPFRWVVKEFGGAVREALTEYSVSSEDLEGAVLIGVGGKLFYFQGKMGAHGYSDDFAAIGSGATWAQGSLDGSAHLKPKKRLTQALAAAARFSGSIRAPWHHVVNTVD